MMKELVLITIKKTEKENILINFDDLFSLIDKLFRKYYFILDFDILQLLALFKISGNAYRYCSAVNIYGCLY